MIIQISGLGALPGLSRQLISSDQASRIVAAAVVGDTAPGQPPVYPPGPPAPAVSAEKSSSMPLSAHQRLMSMGTKTVAKAVSRIPGVGPVSSAGVLPRSLLEQHAKTPGVADANGKASLPPPTAEDIAQKLTTEPFLESRSADTNRPHLPPSPDPLTQNPGEQIPLATSRDSIPLHRAVSTASVQPSPVTPQLNMKLVIGAVLVGGVLTWFFFRR